MRAQVASGAAPLYGSVAVGLPVDLQRSDQANIAEFWLTPYDQSIHTLQRPLLSPEIATPDLFKVWINDGSWLLWHF